MANILLDRNAEKYLESTNKNLKNRFIEEMLTLEENPEVGISLLGQFKGYYKIKFNFQEVSYRIIYRIAWDEDVVYIVLLGPRGDIYKKLGRKLRRR